jgi:hypothetical protein
MHTCTKCGRTFRSNVLLMAHDCPGKQKDVKKRPPSPTTKQRLPPKKKPSEIPKGKRTPSREKRPSQISKIKRAEQSPRKPETDVKKRPARRRSKPPPSRKERPSEIPEGKRTPSRQQRPAQISKVTRAEKPRRKPPLKKTRSINAKRGIRGKRINTQGQWTFSKVVFFSGSICYYDNGETEGIAKALRYGNIGEWSYKYFVERVHEKLRDLQTNDWKYVLKEEDGRPVYADGTRKFKLYTPKRKVSPTKDLGNGVSVGKFPCSASVSQPGHRSLPTTVASGPLKGEANASSRVPKAELRTFVGDLTKNKTLGFPVFSVCDCNSFHTSGYLWGLYAIKKAFAKHGPGPVAALNFDQHRDLGGSTSPVVRSDGWGRPLMAEQELQSTGRCYLSIGNDEAGRVLCDVWGSNGRIRDTGPDFYLTKSAVTEKEGGPETTKMRQSWDGCWQHVKKHIGEIKYVFISVDRDCLVNHYTQWDDRCFFKNTAHLLFCVKAILGSLRTVMTAGGGSGAGPLVIGFDITGLPEHPLMIGHRSRAVVPAATVWGPANMQVTELLKLAAGHLQRTVQVITKT